MCVTQARPEGRSIKGKSLSSSTNIMGPLGTEQGVDFFFFLVSVFAKCFFILKSLGVQPVSRLAQTAEVISVDREVTQIEPIA